MKEGQNEKCPKCGKNDLVVLSDTHPTWLYFRCSSCRYAGTYDSALRKVIETD